MNLEPVQSGLYERIAFASPKAPPVAMGAVEKKSAGLKLLLKVSSTTFSS